MAYITQFGTATSANTSLTPAAVLVGTFTNTVRIRKLYVNIFMDQVKGGGDYVANIRVQRAGAGSEYVSIKTTLTLAAGVTAGYIGSIPVTLNATDVMKVYLLGTAADSDSTADIIVDVNEEYVATDANGYVALGAILGTALTESIAGYLAAGFKKLFNVASPLLTESSVNQTGDAYAELIAFEATIASLSDFFTVNTGQTGAGAVAGSVVHEIGHAVLAIATVFPSGAIQFTYTVTNSVTGLPIEGVEVWFSTDLGAANIVWKGDTDAFGVARDVLGNLPALDVGIYYVWRQRSGFTFSDPDTEDVS